MAPRITPAIEQIIADRIAAAIAEYEANRAGGSGTNNSETTPVIPLAAQRTCSYKDFLNCKPTNFKGTEGAVALLRWFEKMESVFRISNCPENCKVKFSTCTLLDSALTWWNSKAQALGADLAYEMNWVDFKQLMTDKYFPRNEVLKLESEFWDLKVKGDDVEGYSNRFLELAILCPHLVTPEYKKVERYIWGLSEPVQGLVTTTGPVDIQKAIQLATILNDQFIRGKAAQASVVSKRKSEDDNNNNNNRSNNNSNRNNNYNDNQQNKRQDVGKAYNINNSGKTRYAGNKPQCNECNRHHTGVCDPACGRCQRHGHHAENCRTILQRGTTGDCYGCGEAGHFRKDCPRLNNINFIEGPANDDENQ